MNGDRGLLRGWLAELPVWLCALGWGGVCIVLAARHGIYFGFADVRLNAMLFLVSAFVLLALDLFLSLARQRPASPIAFARERYFAQSALHNALARLPMLVICVAMLPFFSKMKSMIPLFNTYTWDPVFIAWDRAIFFGYDAWEILWPLLGNPWITAAIGVCYHLWILLLYPGTLFMLFAPVVGSELRRRFFLSYVLGWGLLGGILATVLASVGPVFAEPLLGIHTFAHEMELLRAGSEQVPFMPLPVQDMLLERFHEDARGLGSGITAMPSLHVAIAFLFWLSMRQIDRWAGRFFLAFFAIIWIGSVHTAYHYFVDGLVSVVGMTAIWWISGMVVRAWDRLIANHVTSAMQPEPLPAQ